MDREELYNLYVVKRLNMREISQVTGRHRNTISKYIDLYDLKNERLFNRIGSMKPLQKRGRKPHTLIGATFNYLRVEKYLDSSTVLCTCICGKEVVAPIKSLSNERIVSCGCKERINKIIKKPQKNSVMVEVNGEYKTLGRWARELKFPYYKARYRYSRGVRGIDLFK